MTFDEVAGMLNENNRKLDIYSIYNSIKHHAVNYDIHMKLAYKDMTDNYKPSEISVQEFGNTLYNVLLWNIVNSIELLSYMNLRDYTCLSDKVREAVEMKKNSYNNGTAQMAVKLKHIGETILNSHNEDEEE